MRRVLHLVRKELLELRQDPRLFGIVILAPIIQLTVLGYAATTDVKDVPLVIVDPDRSAESRALLARFQASDNFELVGVLDSTEQIDGWLDRGEAWMALSIPADYGARIQGREPVTLQVVADGTDANGHEQVVFCYDKPTGLRAIIAIYSTALGPALGGTRFYPYTTEAQAVDDVLHLSKGMAYKNALARLDLGGGKAVIWGNPDTMKTESLLRAYGRFVESLGGRYITACDVGTYVEDMDVVARESRFVTGAEFAIDGGLTVI